MISLAFGVARGDCTRIWRGAARFHSDLALHDVISLGLGNARRDFTQILVLRGAISLGFSIARRAFTWIWRCAGRFHSHLAFPNRVGGVRVGISQQGWWSPGGHFPTGLVESG